MKMTRRPCPGCGRDVAVRRSTQNATAGGKHVARHKCPHGRECYAGSRFANNGWNPGGSSHSLACAECAGVVRNHSTEGAR